MSDPMDAGGMWHGDNAPDEPADPTYAAREIMKQQAREAGRPITERWHNHTSLAYCHPSRCPAGGTDWDGRGLVSDHFTPPDE